MSLARPVALLLGCLLLVSVAVASPQPNPICGACGTGFEVAAEDDGLELNVTASTATVQIHRNGSATWHVTNRLDQNSTARLANDTATVSRIGRRAVTDNYGLPHVYEDGTVTVQSVRLENRTLVLRFRDPDAATRRLGIQVVDYLHSEGVRGGWQFTTDNFSIVGPPETTVVNDPRAPFDDEYTEPYERPTVNGRTVYWHPRQQAADGVTFDHEEFEPVIYEDIYVAYGPAQTNQWRVDAALALATAPIWLDNVLALGIPVTLLAGLTLLVSYPFTRRASDGSMNPVKDAGVTTALGLAGLVIAILSIAVDEPGFYAGLAAIYLVVGSAGLTRPRLFESVRDTLAVSAMGLLAVGAFFTGEALVSPHGRPPWLVAKYVLAHLPVVLAPTVGVAMARAEGPRSLALAVLAGVLSAVLAVMAVVPYDNRPWVVFYVAMAGAALLAGACAVPLLVLAARLSGWDDPSPDEPTEDWLPIRPPTSPLGIGLTILLVAVLVLLILALATVGILPSL